jgi:CBS-domain-containing membrane protein
LIPLIAAAKMEDVSVLLKGYMVRMSEAFTKDAYSTHLHKPSFDATIFSMINSFFGILVISRINKVFDMDEIDLIMIVGSFGAQATLVFAAPSSPLAQPWNCIVGNAVSSAIGVAMYKVVFFIEKYYIIMPNIVAILSTSFSTIST